VTEFVLSIVLWALQAGLLAGTVVVLGRLVRAVAEAREVAESVRSSSKAVEAMSRNIVSAYEPVSRDLAGLKEDVLSLGGRMTDAEGRIERIEKVRQIT
jgi:hypothetical protein